MKHHTDHASSRMRARQAGWVALWLTMAIMPTAAARAQITHDGSLAMPCPLNGPSFVIPAACGRTVGSNLFHSFSQFNIQTGESATFTNLGGINNVLVRVTGDQASTINGTLATELGSTANFYLMNPNGVMFGPGASIDVDGALVVTTADAIHLADGQTYVAEPGPDDAMLTTARPESFGFLSEEPAPIQITGTTLRVDPGQSLSVVGGDIELDQGELRAPGGKVTIIAADSSGQVTVDVSDPQAPVESDLTGAAGDVSLINDSTAAVNASGSGRLVIHGHQLTLDDSTLNAETSTQAGGDVDIRLEGPMMMDHDAKISTSTTGPGDSGALTIHAESLDVRGGAQILALTLGSGNAGPINVFVDQGITLDGPDSGISTQSGAAGDAGVIHLEADRLDIFDRALVFVNTFSSGAGGRIEIETNTLNIDGRMAQDGTGLGAQTVQLNGGGAGGDITVDTKVLTITHGSIGASTFGSAAGGDITITADRIDLDGRGAEFTGIVAETGFTVPNATGPGGRITLMGRPHLTLRGGAIISTASFGFGDAGTIDAQLASLMMTTSSSIRSSSQQMARAGAVTVDVTGSAVIQQMAEIATAAAMFDAGDIQLTTGDDLTLKQGRITAEAARDGGNIKLTAPNIVRVVDQSLITAQAGRDGAAIGIDPIIVILDNSTINGLSAGQPVVVTIVTDFFFSSNSQILTNAPIDLPQTDVTGSLLLLSENVVDPATRLAERCAVLLGPGASTFVQGGRGGLATEPGAWLPALITSRNSKATNGLMLQIKNDATPR